MCNVLPLPPMLMPLDKYAFWKNRKGLNMLLFHFFFSFYIVFRLLAFNLRYLAGENEFMCDINQFFLIALFFRLVAFNLGYLPGGDKTLITVPHTTEMALRAASKLLESKGLISIIVYVGHPGGR